MTQRQINDLKSLEKAYNQKHGAGSSEEILGALMFSHSIGNQIKLLRKSRGCRIIVKDEPGVIDGVHVSYNPV